MSKKDRETFEGLVDAIRGGTNAVCLSGLTSIPAKAYFAAQLRKAIGRPVVIVTPETRDLETWNANLAFFADQFGGTNDSIVVFPAFETDPYSGASPHPDTERLRAETLWRLASETPDILVTSATALAARIVSPAEVAESGCKLQLGSEYPPEKLTHRLVAAGYVREDPVTSVGQYSIRGGIIDIWPPDRDLPVRLDFFGDEVDSIRSFDPATQLSTGKLNAVDLAPMRELAAEPDDMRLWAAEAEERFTSPELARGLSDRLAFAEHGETFSGWEFLFPLIRPLRSSILDHLDKHILLIDEPVFAEAAIEELYANTARHFAESAASGQIGLRPDELFFDPEHLRELVGRSPRLEMRALGLAAAATDENHSLPQSSDAAAPLFLFPPAAVKAEAALHAPPARQFNGDIKAFVEELKQRRSASMVAATHGMAERIEEILREYSIDAPAGTVRIGSLTGGFSVAEEGIDLITEAEIFGNTIRPQPSVRSSGTGGKRRVGAFISDFRDLKQGDYVVHIDHGIGRFEGLQTITSPAGEREFMLLVYAEDTKLFVPVERLDLVSRYASGESVSPTLDKLGGIGWQKTKAKAKRAMRDMADELLKLYAERKLVTGYAFSPDAPWQHEFEDAFPYELTPDQAKAIADVKEDMQSPRPMDRLIVGDVGYGKTEVAMRAAFKAVMDGKQVAILAPTTILAYQHFESFTKRFAAFPVKTELLSRFRSKAEQADVVAEAEKGEVDVLIGTHRILSNDVKLPKLGLVVVDEEQRFGVGHKEKLKQLRKKVDVLTLSATPIPRTLNMSLMGIRDMSIIETPPRDRLAINTQVVQFGESVIRSAIELEMARKGQVFFIHNRVETIDSIGALIQKIVPAARIAIGHGKMNEKQMEQVMLDFVDFKYDVLVATTIIENGIDIPRANTILMNRADNYGLSQLYQLRGRVGRSDRRAYAYLLIPSELELTPIARRRLAAIREFSDLGAGFRIAALDLELRGAGNLLGGQQSGHLDALGFDLYTRMLERTVAELRGEEVEDETPVNINLGIDLAIPHEYISETSQRLRTYKRISAAASGEDISQIRNEIEDRYGRLPDPVESLLAFTSLRRLAESMRVVSIDRVAEGAAVKLSQNAKVNPDALMSMVENGEDVSFSPSGILRFPLNGLEPVSVVRHVLESIRG
ncbi:MAG: transcription-repair coupling factor [Acidobacteria bacterium]|nr:transcription-repair coupling factor [Acidobacteriota bacterium]